jgi:plasmid stability protein
MVTITIKGIPKDTHRELKKRAAAHRRSLNSEVITVLESSVGLVPQEIDRVRPAAKAPKKRR